MTTSRTPNNLWQILSLGSILGSSKMVKDFIFYAIAANVIALIAALAGASLPVILFSSLLLPPVILIIIRLIR